MNPTLTHLIAAERTRELHDAADRHRRAAVRTSKPRLGVLMSRPLRRCGLLLAREGAA